MFMETHRRTLEGQALRVQAEARPRGAHCGSGGITEASGSPHLRLLPLGVEPADPMLSPRRTSGDRQQVVPVGLRGAAGGSSAPGRAVSHRHDQMPDQEAGMATAEYAIATLAAVAFAALLVAVLSSGEIKGLLMSLITSALNFG
jgi:hypothetical protein